MSIAAILHLSLCSLGISGAPKLAIALLVGRRSAQQDGFSSIKCCLSEPQPNLAIYTSKKLVFNLVLFLQPSG
jgi:hypothetical protein